MSLNKQLVSYIHVLELMLMIRTYYANGIEPKDIKANLLHLYIAQATCLSNSFIFRTVYEGRTMRPKKKKQQKKRKEKKQRERGQGVKLRKSKHA